MSIKRWDAKTDENQADLVRFMESIPGISVLDLSGVGDGCTDLLVQQYAAGEYKLHLMEVKTQDGKLRGKQVEFHAKWYCHIIRTEQDILDILGL